MNTLIRYARRRNQELAALIASALVFSASAQSPGGAQSIKALQQGGYVIVMRHANSPGTPPEASQADKENVQHERQLDEAGRSSAITFGEALRRLKIPIGQVQSSPTYRALETLRLAKLGEPETAAQLGDSGHSMQADPSGARAAWLRARAATLPRNGTNRLIVTHFPNIMEIFPQDSTGLEEGDALIFHPDGHGGVALVARVKIDQWAHLAALP